MPPIQQPPKVNWLFTLNNYTTDEELVVKRLFPDKGKYIIFGHEVGEQEGTPHLQGYFQCNTKQRLTALKKWIPRGSFRPADGTAEQNKDYCTKQDTDNFHEAGVPTVERQRSDIKEFKEFVKQGNRNPRLLLEEFPEIVAKYPRFVKTCCDTYRPRPKLPSHELFPWQASLNIELKRAADRRTIYFVYDREGNKGKSWFADYYCAHHDDAQVLEMGKKADIALALNPECRVFFFDVTRDQCDFMNYSVLEALKNGRIFSPKYESSVVYLAATPHVVVLMNHEPDYSKLSADRYRVITI